MAKMSNVTPINTVWAEDTPNVVFQGEGDIEKGIEFQQLIVSNQLNSSFKTLGEAVRWSQASGGMWIPTFNYSIGNIVSLIISKDDSLGGYEPLFFVCVRDNVNQCPFVGAFAQTQYGVSVYTGGSLNSTYWTVCDAQERRMDKKIEDATKDKWKNLGSVSGSYNMSFLGDNDNYNNFTIQLSGATQFATVSYSGAKERSGLFCITSGGRNLRGFFSNAYWSFPFPIVVKPNGSNNGDKLIFPYKLVPNGLASGVYFTFV